MPEGLSSHPEQLSNRRLMYETFVTALRRVSVGMSDAHYVRGTTQHGNPFKISDYFYYEVIDQLS